MEKKSGPGSDRQYSKSAPQGAKRKKAAGPGTPYNKSEGTKRTAPKRSPKSDDTFNRDAFADTNEEKKPFRKTDGPKPFPRSADSFSGKPKDKPFGRSKPTEGGESSGPRDRKPKEAPYGSRPFGKSSEDRPFRKEGDKPFARKSPSKPYGTRSVEGGEKPPRFEKPERGAPERKKFNKEGKKSFNPSGSERPAGGEGFTGEKPKKKIKTSFDEKPVKKRITKTDEKRPFKRAAPSADGTDKKKQRPEHDQQLRLLSKKILHEDDDDDFDEDAINAGIPIPRKKPSKSAEPENMPLNKYMAHSGVCSRRDAATLVREGKVKVNDELVLDPGHKVLPTDVVTMGDKKLTLQKGMVYILLNKPKDYITTNDDPQGRKTVMDLVEGADAERLFPVGRLDRNTSGLLLITNDGDLTQKLAHPSYKVKKIYHVTLDKPLTKADSEKIMAGLELEDGVAIVDALAFLEAKNELGIEIHSGKNRIVRRIFEHLGYVVEKLDRMMYAGLTKKNLPRGKWRYLNEREIILLKHFKS